MPRLLAIVAVLMLLAGAVAGMLALAGARSANARALPSALDTALRSENDPALPPLYDIPKLDKITIDGSPADWGRRGLRVEVLANASGKVQPKADIDANLRLGWNETGLLALVTVSDDIALEDANPAGGDSVELFVSPRVGSPDVVRAVIGPGVDPAQPRLRTRLFDLRTDPQLRKVPPTAQVSRTKIDGGYVIEALIPWSNLGIKPRIGGEMAFQIQVNDVDASRQGSQLVWFPSTRTAHEPSKMQRLRLAAAPGPAVNVAAYGDYPRMHRTRISVVGDVSLAGKKVEVVRRGGKGEDRESRLEDGNTTTAPSSIVDLPSSSPVLIAGRMECDFIRPELAAANLSLPMPQRGGGYGMLDVLIDGKRAGQVDLPDPGDMAHWLMPYEEFVFKPCIFSGRAFPEGDFGDPSYVEDLIGPYEVKITYYDTNYQVVTTADKPGRYGAVVEAHTDEGRIYKRYRTLFREPHDFSWRNTEIPFTVALPKEMGISVAALKVQARSVNDYFKQLLEDDGLNRDADTAVLLAGLYETKAGEQSLQRNSPQSMDRHWWAGLKLKIGEPVMKHLVFLPRGYGEGEDGRWKIEDSKTGPAPSAVLDPPSSLSVSARRWPLVLFLHGKGECGEEIDQVKEAGLVERLQFDRQFAGQFPAIVIAPQCPVGGWWSSYELAALLDEVQAKYRVDADRIYVTGMSMGGYGTWALATEFPDRFAAIAPVCGGGDADEARRLVNLPIWASHGAKDGVVPIHESQQMVEALQTLGGNVRFTVYPEAGHDAWTETYANPELYSWLFEHRRSNRGASQRPVLAGPAVPATMPVNAPH